MEKVYIVMPAYNEEASIEQVVKEWYVNLEDKGKESRLVVADSGSTDKTHDILVKLKEQYPQLEILSETNQYHGPKLIALYDYAIKNGADYIFQTDSDGQTDPNEFKSFWEQIDKYDCILGYRHNRGDGKHRAFIERVVCLLVRLYFGVRVPDANAPFRLMRASVVGKYLYKLPSDFNIPNIMLTTYFCYKKERTLFKKITFQPREKGKSSLNIPKIIKIGMKAMKDFSILKKEMNNEKNIIIYD